ncbi:MAG: hypothetical protein COA42_24155 [Alteromonadaceae bacterium]|nr:MAG: hypothetical protein COA42_24155 [Alteromonadaceae bacterium]
MFEKIVMLSLLASSASAFSFDDTQDDLSLSYGNIEMVSIATGSPQPIKKAPAVVSVITAEQIRQIGASDLDEVLTTVPGLHLINNWGRAGKYVFRGIYSTINSEALLLINGVPIRNLVNGNHFVYWGGMPINAIARIEVIRGPGSALYGADAFAGVINVWTKQAQDIKGVEIGSRLASFNNKEAWIQYGGDFAGIELAVSAEVLSYEGHDEIINADAQTPYDKLFGTNASAAPESANNQVDGLELRFDAKFSNWRLRAGFQQRENMGTGVGALEALDNNGKANHKRGNIDITYNNDTLVEGLRLEVQTSYYQAQQLFSKDLWVFPPGAFGGAFLDGMIGSPEWEQHNIHSNVSFHYSGIDYHNFLLGAGYEHAEMDKVEQRANFYFDNDLPPPLNELPIPIGEIITVRDDEAFIPEKSRTNSYILLQDEWSLANDWQLIAGIRHDNYSDFGTTTNPRFALVWDTTFNLTSKFLFGRAYKAPSFNELYSSTDNNPLTQGSEQLGPQTIETLELAFNYQFNTQLNLDFNFFYNKIKDAIVYETRESDGVSLHVNSGKISGHGAEFAFSYAALKDLMLRGNYAYQKTEEKISDGHVGFAPSHEVYLQADWQIADGFELVNKVRWVGERPRSATDARNTMDGYTQWDLLFHWRSHRNNTNITLGAFNLADADIRDPSVSTGAEDPVTGKFPGNIPDDVPQAGRNFSAKANYRF